MMKVKSGTWLVLLLLAVTASACGWVPDDGISTPDVAGLCPGQFGDGRLAADPDDERDCLFDREAKVAISEAIVDIQADRASALALGDAGVAIKPDIPNGTDEHGRSVPILVEEGSENCSESPYCVQMTNSGDSSVLGVAAWSPLGCVVGVIDVDYGPWWGQAAVGISSPCAGSVAKSDYRHQRGVGGTRDSETHIDWQPELPDGRTPPEVGTGEQVVQHSSGDCYTGDSDSGAPRGVNRYAVALLRGTANAGELDEYDHCKYLAAVTPSQGTDG